MIIEINKKKYTVKVGTRVTQNLIANLGIDNLTNGKISFDVIVDMYMDAIRGAKPTKADLEEWVDDTPNAAANIMEEVAAFQKLAGEAKK